MTCLFFYCNDKENLFKMWGQCKEMDIDDPVTNDQMKDDKLLKH